MKINGYATEKNFSELNCGGLVEPDINHLASSFISANYDEILMRARKYSNVDPSKAEDLVHDVWVSIAQAEEEGEGYNISHSNNNDVISVREFVYGRMDGYSKNRRYAKDGCDRHISKKNVKGTQVGIVDFDIAFASAESNDPDQMDNIQRAYFNAYSYDDEIDGVEDEMSLRQNVEFCLDFNGVVGFNLMNLFKNIDMFNRNIDSSIFDNLREKMKFHDEFGEALSNVLLCAKDHRGIYDAVLATF